MNDDELDLLASAYLDGEATPDEVAMVERDPELQARVEEFRATQADGSIAPPPGLIDRHLAAAMAEFDVVSSADATTEQATAGAAAGSAAGAAAGSAAGAGTEIEDAAGETAPVVDLAAASARRSERRARPARRRTMPSWLPAAAGLFIIGGGAVWAIGQSGGGDDTEAASVAAADEADEDEESSIETDAGSAELAESDDGGSEAMTAMADEAMEADDSAMEDDAMADEGDDTASRADADAAAPAEGGADEEAEEESAEDAEEGFVDLEPKLSFDEVPDVDDLTDLPEPEADLERSLCGPEIVTPTLGEPLGFIPVEVAGEPAEIYLFVDADGTEIRLLIDGDCQPLTP